ncbi:DENN domain-containing protein 3-like [Leptonychotes weddellii]|uniref:DENN domain-containing protein 3-like n=1 Tax=Leptonychotes weddellii TaxID=9713 RepID=A0A7F8RUQ3_LEPWE|nr:DENN domain-containing protein 3-like [Leptonychotes weddellii]
MWLLEEGCVSPLSGRESFSPLSLCPQRVSDGSRTAERGSAPPAYSYFSLLQMFLKNGVRSPSSLDPEVLSIFVPPFITKEDSQMAGAPCVTLSKTRRRSFRKKKDKPKTEPWKGLPPEDVSVPNGVDLLALPQLCFPGGVNVASEPREDCVHFLVLTDVCGNRTYGVVAQYYRPLHVRDCREFALKSGCRGFHFCRNTRHKPPPL